MAHAELAAELAGVDVLPLVGEGRAASDHEHFGEACELSDQVLRHAVGEVFLLGVAAHVREGQNHEGCEAAWLCERRLGRGGCERAAQPECVHWAGEVLQRLFAEIEEREVEPAADVLVDRRRQADPPGSASVCSRAATFTPSP